MVSLLALFVASCAALNENCDASKSFPGHDETSLIQARHDSRLESISVKHYAHDENHLTLARHHSRLQAISDKHDTQVEGNLTLARHHSHSEMQQATPPQHEMNRQLANATGISFYRKVKERIEMELEPATLPVKNKLILAAIELSFLGCCGFDRCYMGQITLGVAKGLTLGGFCLWSVLDWVVIMATMLSWSTFIDAVGYQANFEDDWTISAAGMLTVAALVCKLCCSGGGVRSMNASAVLVGKSSD